MSEAYAKLMQCDLSKKDTFDDFIQAQIAVILSHKEEEPKAEESPIEEPVVEQPKAEEPKVEEPKAPKKAVAKQSTKKGVKTTSK